MNIKKSLIGRRQFLIATGVTSASALALNKLTGAVANPVFQTGSAIASDASGGPVIKGAYSDKYSHLLSPLRIGNIALKSRMMQTPSIPRNLVGPEDISADQMIDHYANIAKNGCSICFVEGISNTNNETLNRYHAQMIDAIHFGGSLACTGASHSAEGPMPAGGGPGGAPGAGSGGASGGATGGTPGGAGGGEEYAIGNRTTMWNGDGRLQRETPAREIPAEMIQEMIKTTAENAKLLKSFGYDALLFGMSYRKSMLAQALSPVLNTRKDNYGGSRENRARLALEMFQAVKKACGQDFLVIANISGEELGKGWDGSYSGGYTTEDAVEYTKVWEGALDILMVRGWSDNESHPTSFNFPKGDPPLLRYSEAIKKGGAKIVVAPNGGFRNPDLNEEYIATGKADMIAMARNWIAEPEYGRKLQEGRGEDVVPCLLCNECHTHGRAPWLDGCTVNPKMGIAHRLPRLIDPPAVSRKVAVIGGGPAGMKAAITASERGHRVDLYEKNDYLGGQLKIMDYVSFKWTFKEFKDYLVRQVKKSGIEVHLSTHATPEMIKAKRYDAVLVALGSEPIIPDISGATRSNLLAPVFAHGNKALGKNIVVIGGDQIGTETGMHLVEAGRRVTVLAIEKSITEATQTIKPFDSSEFYLSSSRWEPLGDTFSYITEITIKGISEKKVIYMDARGNEKSIQADSVIVSAGRKPRLDEAMEFAGSARRFLIIGDCDAQSDVVRKGIRKAIRSAFAAASKI
jgi:2,4-dienoyl-CoA reductase-like NADH-dependent reductase (Old Yellow Enzyme family)/thioredoxin reductase